MTNKTKKIIIVILLLIFLIIPKNYVYAFPGISGNNGLHNGGEPGTTPPGEPGPGGSPPEDPNIVFPDGDHSYKCYYSAAGGSENKIDINAYDTAGNSLVPYSKKTPLKLKAGTWVGINIRETKYISWAANISKTQEIIYTLTVTAGLTSAFAEDHPFPSTGTSEEQAAWYYLQYETATACSAYGGSYDYNQGQYMRGEYKKVIEAAEKNNSRYCSVTTSGPTENKEKGGAAPDKIINECGVKVVAMAIGEAGGGLEPTLQFKIINPNEYITNETNPNKYIMFEDDPPNYTVAKLNGGCDGGIDPTFGVPLEVSCDDNGALTRMPKGGLAGVLQNLSTDNWRKYQSGTYHATYEYTPPRDKGGESKTCINIKTSKVCYDCDRDADCSGEKSDYLKKVHYGETTDLYLNPGNPNAKVQYWYYFIPLNTPTSEAYSNEPIDKNKFFIRVSSKKPSTEEKGNWQECLSMLERYPIPTGSQNSSLLDYRDFIVPIIGGDWNNEGEFKGNYHGPKSIEDSSSDIRLFKVDKNECKISVRVEFNIEQEFYGESANRKNLSGYRFYYRPIDPQKPFPNDINADSIWYNLYDEKTNSIQVTNQNDPDSKTTQKIYLKNSFKEVTYSTEGLTRSNIVKAIEKNSNYASWKNMKNTGLSYFIDNLMIRKTNKKCIYPLGCGPDNLGTYGCPTNAFLKECSE